MKGFYEQDREEKGLAINRNGDHSFEPHYHANLELLLVGRGGYLVNVNENSYEIEDGELVVVDSYDIHSYRKNDNCEKPNTCVVVIPYEYLGKFNERKQGARIENSVLKNPQLCEKLLQIIDGFLLKEQDENVLESGIDLALSLLCKELRFTEDKTSGEVDLVRKILSYIHENYQENITRMSIARTLGYTETHISKVFHRFVKKGISAYINELRLNYIEKKKGEKTLNDLIFEAGFNSERTYYRYRKGR